MHENVVVIGAGPAGLTAAYELLKAGYKNVTVLEADSLVGGISRTVNYKGNRIDIGGHRFFSKSDWVMDWWRHMLPVAMPENGGADEYNLAYQGAHKLLGAGVLTAKESARDVMLLRERVSRIYFKGEFFDYPLKPNFDTARKLGMSTCVSFGVSLAYAKAFPLAREESLEDFFINRFGKRLYLRFFKEYTEKVWGVPCSEISAEWGAQRIKSLSLGAALAHAIRKRLGGGGEAEQTSLIESFLYPKFGPGQMWETVAERVQQMGGRILMGAKVVSLERVENHIRSVTYRQADCDTKISTAHVISTMPVKDLVEALNAVPSQVFSIGSNLEYRDFITVGVLYRKLCKTKASLNGGSNLVRDNWIYIQEPGVKVGRVQIFNNWSPYMVADPSLVWVGLEFFARYDDDLSAMSDEQLKRLALMEMQKLNLAHERDAVDCVVIRMPKAYPGYFGQAYAQFDHVKDYLDGIGNLFLVGRNGMHRYNNQDHSMLSAKCAADAILSGNLDKSPIWAVNIDDDYHEEVASGDRPSERGARHGEGTRSPQAADV